MPQRLLIHQAELSGKKNAENNSENEPLDPPLAMCLYAYTDTRREDGEGCCRWRKKEKTYFVRHLCAMKLKIENNENNEND